MAEADPKVKDIVYFVDSPGGEVNGLFATSDVMRAATKPSRTIASLAASAGYQLAAAGGKITPSNRSSTFGSIGVVASYFVDEFIVDVTSTEAPDKRPDPTTEEGKATIRAFLDQLHSLFVEDVAANRNRE